MAYSCSLELTAACGAAWELPYAPDVKFGGDTAHSNKATLENDWEVFARHLGSFELPRLEAAGWGCWLPPPGAAIRPDGTCSHCVDALICCTLLQLFANRGRNRGREETGTV